MKAARINRTLAVAPCTVSGSSACPVSRQQLIDVFLFVAIDDGRIEMDSNAVERTIRPIALQRKNTLFAGHDAAAQNWADIASLIKTCKLNKVEPHSHLNLGGTDLSHY